MPPGTALPAAGAGPFIAVYDAGARSPRRVTLAGHVRGGHGDWPGWTVAATTDFAGFERLLSAIAALNGCIGLQALSLKATPEGLMLDFRLTRADESTPAVAKENDDGEMPAGAY
ncbi:hypothetical protein SODG_003519 [Sodalis praecaptivus]